MGKRAGIDNDCKRVLCHWRGSICNILKGLSKTVLDEVLDDGKSRNYPGTMGTVCRCSLFIGLDRCLICCRGSMVGKVVDVFTWKTTFFELFPTEFLNGRKIFRNQKQLKKREMRFSSWMDSIPLPSSSLPISEQKSDLSFCRIRSLAIRRDRKTLDLRSKLARR